MILRLPEEIVLTPEILAPLSMAIGGIVLAWGSAEASLTMCVAMVFQLAEGHHHAEEIPIAMKRKLRFLRLCLRRISILEPFRNDGLALFERTGRLAEVRNDLVHGFLSEVDTKTMTFTFTGLGSIKDQPVITGQPRYTMTQLLDFGLHSMNLAEEVVAFAQRLSETLIPE